jgi:AbrB family looped-hinge helix DNA binding protein
MSHNIPTTKMSSRGQVVIPESIRERLRLGPGAQFAVFGQEDVIMLKVINPPAADEFARLKRELQQQARQDDLKQSDIPKAISKVRGRR